jgi:hypothetical protein
MNKIDIFQAAKEHGQREFNPNETLLLLQRYGYRFWSWGANGFKNILNKALFFKVQGHHHKGYVLITLNAADLYEVRLLTTTGKIKDTMTDLFFDQLFDAIDAKVERISEYTS